MIHPHSAVQAAERRARGQRDNNGPYQSAGGTESHFGTNCPSCGPCQGICRRQPSSALPFRCVWSRCWSQNNPHLFLQSDDRSSAASSAFSGFLDPPQHRSASRSTNSGGIICGQVRKALVCEIPPASSELTHSVVPCCPAWKRSVHRVLTINTACRAFFNRAKLMRTAVNGR
jgi:hypothetical protein